MLDLSRDAFIYAQALGNEGDVDFWCVRIGEMAFEKLPLTDKNLPSVRACLDEMVSSGHHWPMGSGALVCQVRLSGVCVVTIKPMTLDIDGRISPVLMLFNAFGPDRRNAAKALKTIPDVLGRQLSQAVMDDINKLQRLLRWPAWLIFIRIIFTRRMLSD